ncbi:threonine synthase [Ruminococcaceae bacterium OttesenSCG-928-A16]|nr:threonine synthase [Ruminococcaceae bacterium OttesenSCG-928-A16]
MNYTSTRDAAQKVTAQQAILKGLAPGGGLFVPTSLPGLNLQTLLGKTYNQVALAVLQAFLPDYAPDFLQQALDDSYGENFDNKAGHVVKVTDGLFALELWHGPTSAFKDYALQLMPKLLVQARAMLNETDETIFMVATSGDTGKAALEGYKNRPGIKMAVFYPENGVSEVQRLQMATQQGDNLAVYAVKGNFDDTQRGIKIAFNSQDIATRLLAQHKKLSSANSINWGRLLPQIVYYITSYLALCQNGAVAMGQPVDFCVPTGNFGDIMAGYYAKLMGLPVGQLICASNQNNVLSDFFASGKYVAKRPLHKTSSPSMDILVSSNLERLLYHETQSPAQVSQWMADLAEKGEYQVDAKTLEEINKTFAAGWADEEQVSEEIAELKTKYNYLADPHTAVAFKVWRNLPASGRPVVVLSTASPYKFSGKVLQALGQVVPADEFDAIAKLEQVSGTKAPAALTALKTKPVRFTQVIEADEMLEVPFTL